MKILGYVAEEIPATSPSFPDGLLPGRQAFFEYERLKTGSVVLAS